MTTLITETPDPVMPVETTDRFNQVTFTYTDKHNDSKCHHFAYIDGRNKYRQSVNGAFQSAWVDAEDTPYYLVYHSIVDYSA